jgi:hypothetical protein
MLAPRDELDQPKAENGDPGAVSRGIRNFGEYAFVA